MYKLIYEASMIKTIDKVKWNLKKSNPKMQERKENQYRKRQTKTKIFQKSH